VGAGGWGAFSGMKREQREARAFRVRWTTYGPCRSCASKWPCRKTFKQMESLLSWTFPFKAGDTSPQRFEPASPRRCSGPSLHPDLPPHHHSHPTLSEVLSVCGPAKGACARGLSHLGCRGWLLAGSGPKAMKVFRSPRARLV